MNDTTAMVPVFCACSSCSPRVVLGWRLGNDAKVYKRHKDRYHLVPLQVVILADAGSSTNVTPTSP